MGLASSLKGEIWTQTRTQGEGHTKTDVEGVRQQAEDTGTASSRWESLGGPALRSRTRGDECVLQGPLCEVLGRVARQTNTAACLDRNQAGRFQPALPLPLPPQNGGCHALIGRLGAGQNPH